MLAQAGCISNRPTECRFARRMGWSFLFDALVFARFKESRHDTLPVFAVGVTEHESSIA